MREHVQLLRAAGHTVHVLTWRSPDAVEEPHVTRLTYAPSKHERLFYGAGAPENLVSRTRAALIPSATAAMWRAARVHARDADLIVGHWLVPSGFIAREVARQLGLPSLVIGHSGGVHALAKLPPRIGRTLAERICDGPVSLPSHALRDKLDRVLGRPSHARILPMGFHPLSTEPVPAEPTEPGSRALFMGRLVPIKQPEIAVRASGYAGVPLDIAGDGPLRPSLELLARKLNAPVTFHGVVTGPAKRDLLQRAGAFLLPSIVLNGRHEGLPVSALEAAATGAIPLLGDVPSLHDLTPETWQRPHTPHDWAASLQLALTPQPLLRQKIAENALNYAWATIGPTWTQWIDELVAQPPWPGSSRSA